MKVVYALWNCNHNELVAICETRQVAERRRDEDVRDLGMNPVGFDIEELEVVTSDDVV